MIIMKILKIAKRFFFYSKRRYLIQLSDMHAYMFHLIIFIKHFLQL